MPEIKYPEGTIETESQPQARQRLLNCFNNLEGKIVSVPGFPLISTLEAGAARGSFEWNGSLFVVAGTMLLRATDPDSGTFVTVGAVSGSENIKTAVGFNDAVIVVPGGAIYTLNKSNVLSLDISATTNFRSCSDVTHMNGRFVYIPSDGTPAFYSNVGDASTVLAASFFDAEELPDLNNGVFNLRNTLVIAGTDSLEFFRGSTNPDTPFIRVEGSRADFGYIGGFVRYDRGVLFIGREQNEDFGIYSLVDGTVQKVSDEGIDLKLGDHTIAEMGGVITNRYKWRGYEIATFELSRISFGYFKGKWHDLETIVGTKDDLWGGGFITELNTKYYTASGLNFGRLEKINSQYNNPIKRIIDIGFNDPEGNDFALDRLEMGISQGFNVNPVASDPVGSKGRSVAIFMSRDNVQYPIALYRQLGGHGQYSQKLMWEPPGGLGVYTGFVGIRIYTTENIDFNQRFLIASFS